MKPFTAKYGYVMLVCILAVVSFMQFSPFFFNRYSSDNAIHVLMAYHLKLPADLYYWGQDRLGSLVPMVAAIPVKLFGLSPMWCVSIVQYLFLLAGFFIFASFVRRMFLKIMLCIIWFFPLQHFECHVLIGHPYSAQLFFTGLAVYLLINFKPGASMFNMGSRLFFSALCFMLSVWISDLSVFILPVYLCLYIRLFTRVTAQPHETLFALNRQALVKHVWPWLGGLILGAMFIVYAKSHVAITVPKYDTLFSPLSHIKSGFHTVLGTLKRALLFKVWDILISGHALFTLMLGFVLVYAGAKKQYVRFNKTLTWFFMASCGITFVIVVASWWVELNGYNSRYFVFTYFMLVLALMLYIDRLNNKRLYTMAAVCITCISISGALNAIIKNQEEYNSAKNLPVAEINNISNKLGACGIIGDYWATYNLSSVQPGKIKATTWDYYGVRDLRIIPEVMAQDSIYLAGYNWLDTFPAYRNEFGYVLVKAGTPFFIQDKLELCRYKIANKIPVPLETMFFRAGHAAYIGTGDRLEKTDTALVKDALFFGPMLSLTHGRYSISADIGIMGNIYASDTVIVDLTNTFGQTLIAQKIFLAKAMANGRRIKFEFTVNKGIRHFEIRTFLKGRSRVYMRNIGLQRIGK